jgi:hypothetical protein
MTEARDGSTARRRVWMRLGLAVLLLNVAVRVQAAGAEPEMGLIAVGPDGKGFVEQPSGRAYVPFGVNYYDPNTGWAPKIWRQFDAKRVTQHFEVMRSLGVNCARVFLTAATFQPDADTIDERALEKLDTLIRIARRAGIRLILTGPDHWEGSPAYWRPDRFAGEPALRALENFWRTAGRRYRGEPAIFAWDLLNEPHVPWSLDTWRPAWNRWLQDQYGTWDRLKSDWAGEIKEGDSWGNIAIPENKATEGNPRLLAWQKFREHVADEWVRRQVQAIRQADPTHLVTVGYIQWSYPLVRGGNPSLYAAFNPQRQAQWLDFLCMHFYPLLGRPLESREAWDRNLAYLQSVLAYCHVGKPVVLEEFGWYGGGAPRGQPSLTEDEQDRWIVAEIEATRRLANGWLSWPFADTPTSTDMSKFGGLVRSDLTRKPWARSFAAYASRLAALPEPTPALPAPDVAAALTLPADDLKPLHEKYSRMMQAALGAEKPVRPAFVPNDKGEYTFDTGLLRGTLRQGGKSLGLSGVTYIPTGARLDRSMGLLSFYRVFTAGKRYGAGAWDWPSTATLLDDGAVLVTWPETPDRPFEMTALYRWKDPQTIDLETTVTARKDLNKFESFLACYLSEAFPTPCVYVREDPEAQGKPGLLPARKSYGDWQMFPRDEQVLSIIRDGRWALPPNPVDWKIMPQLMAPLGLRRGAAGGLMAVLMAPPADCFAIATPYEGEGHYSLYFSRFGRDFKGGETARARTRLVIAASISDEQAVALYQQYLKELPGR